MRLKRVHYSRVTEVLLNLLSLVYSCNCFALLRLLACCRKILSTSFQLSSCKLSTWNSYCKLSTKVHCIRYSLCCLFALTARRQLYELFVQFDNVATACQFRNALHDSLNCLNDALSSEVPLSAVFNSLLAVMFIIMFTAFWWNKVEYVTVENIMSRNVLIFFICYLCVIF